MKESLIIFLSLLVVLFLIIIFSTITKRKILLKYSLLWITFSFSMLICLFIPGAVELVSSWLGFEVPSNMVFLIGLILLLLITFALTVIVSNQKLKIVSLTQEMAIIEKKVRELNDRNYL